MSEYLSLPAPKHPLLPQKKKRRPLLVFAALGVTFLSVLFVYGAHQKELLANVTLGDLQLGSSYLLEAVKQAQAIVLDKNLTPIEVTVEYRGSEEKPDKHIRTTYQELGFEYALDDTFLDDHRLDQVTPFLQDGALKGAAESIDEQTVAQLTIDHNKWNAFIDGLEDMVGEEAIEPQLNWDAEQGWLLQEGQKGVKLHDRYVDRALADFIADLQRGKAPTEMTFLSNAARPDMSMEERENLQSVFDQVQSIVSKPIILKMAGEEYGLDLGADQDFLIVGETSVEINEDKLWEWLQVLADNFYRPTNTIRIVDKVESSFGIFDAVVEGEFVEGRRIDVDETTSKILDVLAADMASEDEEEELIRLVDVHVYEIPLRVYSELDQVEYDLLSVGYSEYSKGNAPNRVHNIQLGLKRINAHVIEPGAKISFNKLTGPIDYEFLTGYAIFGPVAKPSLGGGICQVSTTFYRSMLNLGIPITMRQNHSWDLSYYRKGGYGLDATIFPSVGLDVKAVNNFDSHLFIYSYTRPETEEAFILVYGKDDGRKITLAPEEEYIPYYGAKTLKWTQTIEMPDGEVISNDIISRYRM